MITYRKLSLQEIDRELFSQFHRKQEVTRCWRKVEGEWVVKDIAFTDDWTEQDYAFLVSCLRNTLSAMGLVAGAFYEGKLKGFVSVESARFGSESQYVDLSSLHISQDMRRRGIGKNLLCLAKEYAKEQGAKKLYISAHSAVESQAFYRSMGCVEAKEYNLAHVEKEPCDCQLECEV